MGVVPEGLLRHGESRPGNVIGVLHIDGLLRRRFPEKGLHQQWANFPEPAELRSGESLRPGLELLQRVDLPALPDLLVDRRAGAAGAELLVAGGEDGGVAGGGGAGARDGIGGGGEGAVEVGEDELLGGLGQRGYNLADAEGGGLALDAGDEGDGVGELCLGGAVLGGQGEALKPGRYLRGSHSRRRRIWRE